MFLLGFGNYVGIKWRRMRTSTVLDLRYALLVCFVYILK